MKSLSPLPMFFFPSNYFKSIRASAVEAHSISPVVHSTWCCTTYNAAVSVSVPAASVSVSVSVSLSQPLNSSQPAAPSATSSPPFLYCVRVSSISFSCSQRQELLPPTPPLRIVCHRQLKKAGTPAAPRYGHWPQARNHCPLRPPIPASLASSKPIKLP